MKPEGEDLRNVEFPGSFGRNPAHHREQFRADQWMFKTVRSKIIWARFPQRSHGKPTFSILDPVSRMGSGNSRVNLSVCPQRGHSTHTLNSAGRVFHILQRWSPGGARRASRDWAHCIQILILTTMRRVYVGPMEEKEPRRQRRPAVSAVGVPNVISEVQEEMH